MKVLDLFSGIGGFSLGLERAGHETVAFCEFDKKAQLVLKKHWPELPIYDDVKTLTKEILENDGINEIDIICGGFPCQDISYAGKGAGLEGERSGLWFQFHRLIKEIKPKYAVIENVSALRSRGLDEVLRSLAEIGYDAEWHCIPASAVGAPHRRDRVWIIAYANNQSKSTCSFNDEAQKLSEFGDVANTASIGLQGQGEFEQSKYSAQIINGEAIKSQHGCFASFWAIEPSVGRVANGIPNRVDRLKQLGNAVVPQIPELIGRALI